MRSTQSFGPILADRADTVAWLKDFPNLIVTRTFSKVYGLAGLRVGYALCGSDAFVTAVNQVRQPFFCNAAAQAAAIDCALRTLQASDARARCLLSGGAAAYVAPWLEPLLAARLPSATACG